MCGIVGFFNSIESNTDNRDAKLNEMLSAQSHRGPDNKGTWLGENIALGHNRLSIIDLSDVSNQPFISPDKRWILCFNGEIYNYPEIKEEIGDKWTFKTQSDTEVLLAAWTIWRFDALEKFRGMFAFSIWDNQEKQLTLVRDRFGVKPLYYSVSRDNVFVFASEIKSLHAYGCKKEKNEKVWANFLCNGSYGMPNETFWSGVYALEPGQWMQVDKKLNVSKGKWYDFVSRVKALRSDQAYISRSDDKHIAVYTEILKESIKLRFRADVQVGFNVSGGLDSSTLLAMVHQYAPDQDQIKAYSFYTGDERYDELPWVKSLVSKTNKPLVPVKLEVTDVIDQHQKMSFYQDEPYGGIPTLAYANIFKQARLDNVLVLLDGQGMDEQWAGYDYYYNNSGNVVQGVKRSPLKPNVLTNEFRSKATDIIYPEPFDETILNLQYRDLFYTKIPRALRFNDRVSMASSTELREPFLDHLLVEYAFSLPTHLKNRDGQRKWGLRQICDSYLSDNLVFAPKRPLQTPQREWLSEDLLDWVKNKINELETHPWFEKTELQAEWSHFLSSEKDNTFFIWQWLSI